MRTFTPRWYVFGCLLLVWAVWTLADEIPPDTEQRLADDNKLEIALTE